MHLQSTLSHRLHRSFTSKHGKIKNHGIVTVLPFLGFSLLGNPANGLFPRCSPTLHDKNVTLMHKTMIVVRRGATDTAAAERPRLSFDGDDASIHERGFSGPAACPRTGRAGGVILAMMVCGWRHPQKVEFSHFHHGEAKPLKRGPKQCIWAWRPPGVAAL